MSSTVKTVGVVTQFLTPPHSVRTILQYAIVFVRSLLTWLYHRLFAAPPSVHVDGFCESAFHHVRDAFQKNLESGWEPDGAAFVVIHNGKVVVDLFGGLADASALREWREDTLSIAFSSTKAVAALCVAQLVDRGLVTYETCLADFWPAFAQHGKETITLNDVLSHRAGLAYFDADITLAAAQDPELMARLIEQEVPKWTPGSSVGYHALTYGWLVDQIVRRVDPQQRSLGQFFRDELQNNEDFHIGLAATETHRVTRLRLPSLWQRMCEFLHNPQAINYLRYLEDFATDGILNRTERNPSWLRFVHQMTLNNPDFYRLEQGALLGIGTARALARILDRAVFGDVFKNSETRTKLLSVFTEQEDIVTGAQVKRGQGLMFTSVPFEEGVVTLIGHAGVGGQNVRVDVANRLTFCYLSNGLKAGFGDTARTYVRLRDALYASVRTQTTQNNFLKH